MKCTVRDLEVMNANSGWVQLGVHGSSNVLKPQNYLWLRNMNTIIIFQASWLSEDHWQMHQITQQTEDTHE